MPWQSRAFTGRMRTPKAAPAMPWPLFPFAPMIPATCVPCPLSSNVVPGLQPDDGDETKVAPGRTAPARSGCAASMPVSTVATVIAADPRTPSQARSTSVLRSPHWPTPNPGSVRKKLSFGVKWVRTTPSASTRAMAGSRARIATAAGVSPKRSEA